MNPLDSISQRALQFAIKSIMYKRQSVKEMRERLEERYPEADREAIIIRLLELEYLDDQLFCEAYIRHRSLTAPRGKYLLSRELMKKGIPSDIAALCLESFEEQSVIMEVAEKKWEKLHRSEPKKRREQLMRFLASRGFSLREVIETVKLIADEPQE